MATPRNIPLCNINASYQQLELEILGAVERVFSSGQVINGPDVKQLEAALASYCGVNAGVACASGTDALSLAIHALDIGPGDEVILPPYTFFATVGSVIRAGATPIFADIDPVSYNIDPFQVESRITPRTKAIIAVHLFGQCADMEPLWRIAERHDLPIIEDAAQALGAEYQDKRAGSLGAIGCLSFYPSKNLGGLGDGGACVTNDPEWAKKMEILRGHGMEPKYYHKTIGWNARMDTVQAAILAVKLPHLDSWISKRREVAARYDALIKDYHLHSYLERPKALPRRLHSYNQYVVRVANGERDALVQHFKAMKIGCEIYYPLPLHLQECLTHLGYGPGDFPASEEAARATMAFPMFPELTAEEQSRVVGAVADFVRMRHRLAA